MKMAKASEADIEMAMTLANVLDDKRTIAELTERRVGADQKTTGA